MNAHDANMARLGQGLTGQSSDAGSFVGATRDEAARMAQREARKFHAARHYSRRIQFLKISLPLIGLSLIALFVGLAFAAQFVSTPLGKASIDLTNGQVVMDRPSLSGYTASDSAYEIVADRAFQDLTDPKKVNLEKIAATLTLNDGNIVSVDANEGRFNVEGENLRLGAGVRVHMSAGYTAKLEEATIDVKSGTLKSSSPVHITADIGDIRANRLTVRDNGKYILFEDRVRMTVQPGKIRRP